VSLTFHKSFKGSKTRASKFLLLFVVLTVSSCVSKPNTQLLAQPSDNNDFFFRGLKWGVSEEEIFKTFGLPIAITVDTMYFVWINEKVIDRDKFPSKLLNENINYKDFDHELRYFPIPVSDYTAHMIIKVSKRFGFDGATYVLDVSNGMEELYYRGIYANLFYRLQSLYGTSTDSKEYAYGNILTYKTEWIFHNTKISLSLRYYSKIKEGHVLVTYELLRNRNEGL
jgi:hypothetical protein